MLVLLFLLLLLQLNNLDTRPLLKSFGTGHRTEMIFSTLEAALLAFWPLADNRRQSAAFREISLLPHSPHSWAAKAEICANERCYHGAEVIGNVLLAAQVAIWFRQTSRGAGARSSSEMAPLLLPLCPAVSMGGTESISAASSRSEMPLCKYS